MLVVEEEEGERRAEGEKMVAIWDGEDRCVDMWLFVWLSLFAMKIFPYLIRRLDALFVWSSD